MLLRAALEVGTSEAAAARMLSFRAAADRLDEAAEERRATAASSLALASWDTALSICAVAVSERPPMVRPRANHRCVSVGCAEVVAVAVAVEAIVLAALERLAGSAAVPPLALLAFSPARESSSGPSRRDGTIVGGTGRGLSSSSCAALIPALLRVGSVAV
jgi:hypothetical protein